VLDKPPRSWRKDEQWAWHQATTAVKAAVKRRHDETETKIRQLQNEVAELRKQLKPDEPKAVEQKEKDTNGKIENVQACSAERTA
jgi:hypothetical protein